MSCPFFHDNIDTLYNVTPMPIEKLPTVCSCGQPITYSPRGVVFVTIERGSIEGVIEEVPLAYSPTRFGG